MRCRLMLMQCKRKVGSGRTTTVVSGRTTAVVSGRKTAVAMMVIQRLEDRCSDDGDPAVGRPLKKY